MPDDVPMTKMTPSTHRRETNGPMWRRIADELAAGIARGEPAAGRALPTAVELAERYGVHRHTVRQAFGRLQALGLVTVRQGHGTFVTDAPVAYKIGRSVSFRENFNAAGLAVAGRILDAEQRPASADVAEQLGLMPDEPIWRIRSVSEAGGMPVSTAIHRVCARRFPRFGDDLVASGASITATLAANGVTDYERLKTRLSSRLVKPKERRILRLFEGAPVLVSRGLDGLADGTPLHLVESVFAASLVEFVIEPDLHDGRITPPAGR